MTSIVPLNPGAARNRREPGPQANPREERARRAAARAPSVSRVNDATSR
jgi:hypothetical protein